MLRLWWQQPSKQTKSECSALRPDKRGACNMLCSLCVCVKEKHKHQHKHEHGHKHKHESSTRAEAGAKGKRIICFRLPFFVCFTFVIFACLLYHFFLSLSLFLHTVFICSQSEHILHWLPGWHLPYEWWILAHTFTRHSHRQSVDCSSRRASLLYETNLEQLTEEVESGEWGVGSHCLSTAVITAYTAYHKSI